MFYICNELEKINNVKIEKEEKRCAKYVKNSKIYI
jgi:hypothetical protein